MSGLKALRKIQLGKEGTAGTLVAPTAMWRGLGTIEDQREVKFTEEDIGYLSGVDRTYTPKYLAALEMESVPATFEQLLYILAASVSSQTTGVTDSVGSGKIYTYTAPTTAAPSIQPFSIEGGDNEAVECCEYGFVENWKLSGKPGEALMVSASWLARQATGTGGFTTVAVPTVEEILTSKGKLYVDAVNGTLGTTQVSNSILNIEASYKSGIKPAFSATGALTFSHLHYGPVEPQIDLTFEHDTSGQAQKTNWKAETAKLFRLIFEGSAFTTAGVYTYKTAIIDFASKVEKVGKLDEIDGNDVLKVTLKPRYNATAAKFFVVTVVNDLASIT